MNFRISNSLFESIINVTTPPAEKNIEEKKLHPNQQVLDVHEPEKDELTADDFKKLRAMKKTKTEEHDSESAEQVEEEEKKKPVSPFDYKNYKSEIPKKPGELTGHDSKKISTGTVYTKKPVKEESHQSKTTMKHIPNASPALKKAAKDIKPGIAGYRDRIDMFKAGGVKEEAETVEFSLTEEEWDQLDELSKSTLGSYVKKSSRDSRITRKIAADFENQANRAKSPGMKAASNELSSKYKSKSFQRQAGLEKAVDRLTKEEADQMDELSMQTMKSAKEKLGTKAVDAHYSDDKRSARDYAGRALQMGAKIKRKERNLSQMPPVKEGINQTIINYDDFRIDVTDNPTYGDYLRALQTMVESRDENIQQEVVAIATAAYDEKIDSIIIESKARQLFAGKLDEIRKSGSTVLDESYIVESNSTYVEYTVEKDGVRTQYVHIGTNGNK